MTQRRALQAIRALGLTANVVHREYHVDYRQHDPRYKAGTHGTKYFTFDPIDAVDTAVCMSKVIVLHDRRKGEPSEVTSITKG